MNTRQLIDDSLAIIRQTLDQAEKPIIAWSGGKDSQLLLRLVHQVRSDVPVLHLRGFEDERKHDFAEDEIGRSGLLMIEPRPCATDIIAKGDHVEIVEAYRLSNAAVIYFPIEAEPGYVPGPQSHCAIEKINQPTSNEPLDVDCLFVGHRGDDVDPAHGPMPLDQDTAEAGNVLFVYPLRAWKEANIWEASALLNIPQNRARYERGEMSANADYFPLCTECLKPTDKESIICPKIGEPVYAIGKYLTLEQRREKWRDRFVNLKRER